MNEHIELPALPEVIQMGSRSAKDVMREYARTAVIADRASQQRVLAEQAKTAEQMRPDFEWWWVTRSVFPALGTREAAAAWAAWVASGGYKAPSGWELSSAPWGWEAVNSAPQPATEQAEAPRASMATLRSVMSIIENKGWSGIRKAEEVFRLLATQPTASNAGEHTVALESFLFVTKLYSEASQKIVDLEAALASKPSQGEQKPVGGVE